MNTGIKMILNIVSWLAIVKMLGWYFSTVVWESLEDTLFIPNQGKDAMISVTASLDFRAAYRGGYSAVTGTTTSTIWREQKPSAFEQKK